MAERPNKNDWTNVMEAGISSWDPDIALECEAVQALVASQFPKLIVNSIKYLDEGWDNAVYLINGEWVFRFPKRRERQKWLESEIAVLQLLGSRRLPIEVPVPGFLGQPGNRYPCGFIGYRMINGTSADDVEPSDVSRQDSARRIGQFLTALHSIDVRDAEMSGVKSFEWPLADELAEAAAMWETVHPLLPAELKRPCQDFLQGGVPRSSSPRRCVVHGDLEDGHVLLDQGGRVAGIIDWGDAGISDPTTDFRGLYAWLGEDFVREVLEHYRHSHEGVFLEQIAFRARCNALTTFGYWNRGQGTSQTNRLRMIVTAFGVEHPR